MSLAVQTEERSTAQAERLRVSEIFYSLQGESCTVGLPTVFIRLTGCPLRCSYCDTEYAFSGGTWMGLEEIRDSVAQYQAFYVTVTGGEPLAQKPCLHLLERLCDEGYEVSLETSGALSLAQIDSRVTKVMDLKTPASGEAHENCYDNIAHLARRDQVKFVICERQDYEWAKLKMPAYPQIRSRLSASMLKVRNFDSRSSACRAFNSTSSSIAPREYSELKIASRTRSAVGRV